LTSLVTYFINCSTKEQQPPSNLNPSPYFLPFFPSKNKTHIQKEKKRKEKKKERPKDYRRENNNSTNNKERFFLIQ